MKRIGNLYKEICSYDNLVLADITASRGKSKQKGVIEHNKRRGCDMLLLMEILLTGNYKTSPYVTFPVYEPKERLVFKLPYYPDRIMHHAIMNVLEPVFMKVFTGDSYSCIKGKGVHAAARGVKGALKDVHATRYCLKLDIKKFYPSVDHAILKQLLYRKIKEVDLLRLLDEIIDSADGLPIGNYLSQYLANFYLSYFDHWIKEQKGVKYYFRYADDIVILMDNKQALHQLLFEIKEYLWVNLRLKVKNNYQVFPVAARGIDFVGYVFFHTHTLLRKTIKKAYARMMARRRNKASMAAYRGWAIHANTKNLLRKLHDKIQRPRNKERRQRVCGRQDKASTSV